MYRLKEYRERLGLSLRALGEQSGIHDVTIVKLDADPPKLDPQVSTFLMLCEALAVTLNQLVIHAKLKGGT